MDICSVNSYRDDAPGSHYKPVIRHYPWVSPHYIRPLFIGACQVALIANSSMTADRTTGKWSAMSMAISQPYTCSLHVLIIKQINFLGLRDPAT